jgi:glycosyltransferase involved in cell wall biosynthesis
MKTIKIFVVPSHQTLERTSGVDFARVIQPMQHLNGWTNGEVKFKTTIFDPIKNKNLNWIEVVNKYDMIFFNYTLSDWSFAAMGAMARKAGVPMVMDLDDNLWNVASDNVAYEVLKPGGQGVKVLTAITKEVDYVTVTNQYLKNVVIHNTGKAHDRVKVFDNYINLDLYKYPLEFKDTAEITLTHFGSSTHFVDLQNKAFMTGVDRVMKDYPNVNFLTVGSFIPAMRYKWGQRYQNEFGHVDIYKWVSDRFSDVMAKTDICVVPLEENVYTRAKSAIKFLEMSSAVKPGVWQDIRQYQEAVVPGTGLLARTDTNWYAEIKKLIDDKEFRKQMGQNAYNHIKDNYQMKDKIDKYAEFLIGVDKQTKKTKI